MCAFIIKLKMKLNLGCGNKIIPGFINVDCRDLPGVNDVSNIQTLPQYHPNSVDLIYACHVLEHTGRLEYMDVLKRWYEILKPGAVLRVAVPDLEAVFEHYSVHKDLRVHRGLLYGGQTYPENYHYIGWDFKTLKEDLEQVGFTNIRRYDWRATEHADMDDYSQSYLPHMDKVNGMLMSLNVEATK